MRGQGLVEKSERKFNATMSSRHDQPASPNLLEQNFSHEKINKKRADDITYLWTDEGWLYLGTVLDLSSRRVIGWSMSNRVTKELVCDVMNMAVNQGTDFADIIMHTDRAIQYCSKEFAQLIKAHSIR